MAKITYNPESGFTIVEIIVSTAIFVTVVSAMLSLFNYTLQINRRVQALREVSQGTRTFTETIAREIRNGKIDYSSWAQECAAANYQNSSNKSLSIISQSGEKMCFYFDSSNNFTLKRQALSGTSTSQIFDSSRFRIIPSTFHFYVMPKTNPNPSSPPYPGIQPYVTITAQFELNVNNPGGPTIINYQTTISTDVYDTFHQG